VEEAEERVPAGDGEDTPKTAAGRRRRRRKEQASMGIRIGRVPAIIARVQNTCNGN
jgi:hypothetical protein